MECIDLVGERLFHFQWPFGELFESPFYCRLWKAFSVLLDRSSQHFCALIVVQARFEQIDDGIPLVLLKWGKIFESLKALLWSTPLFRLGRLDNVCLGGLFVELDHCACVDVVVVFEKVLDFMRLEIVLRGGSSLFVF